MGKVIAFPIERRRPHVALVWDHAWDEYRIEVVGVLAPAGVAQWTEDYGEALDLLISKGQRLNLPVIDCTTDGRVSA